MIWEKIRRSVCSCKKLKWVNPFWMTKKIFPQISSKLLWRTNRKRLQPCQNPSAQLPLKNRFSWCTKLYQESQISKNRSAQIEARIKLKMRNCYIIWLLEYLKLEKIIILIKPHWTEITWEVKSTSSFKWNLSKSMRSSEILLKRDCSL
jgi:hypothetical protein